MQIIYSDIQNFLEEASKKIELDVLKIKDIDIKDVLDMLIKAGIFKNEFSAKIFLTSPHLTFTCGFNLVAIFA